MPDKKQSTAPAASIAPIAELIPATQLHRYPTNRHPDPESVAHMAVSIREHGIIQPILVREIYNPQTTGHDLQIVFGETRWRAAQSLDPHYLVPCYIRELDDREAAKIHAIENFQRKDLTEIEQAREIQHLRDVGWELEEITNHLGKEKSWLSRRLGLLKLPPEGQQAVIDGNISILTAAKIVSLPETLRSAAIKAVVEPTHAARALPEREALALLQKDFLEPLERETAWNEKRKLLQDQNPGVIWLEYKHAAKADQHSSDYERADTRPLYAILSDAARADELPVPTWEELARKHAAPIYLGLTMTGDPALFISPDAIIEAEKAHHDQTPGDCIFTHEKAVRENRAAAEKRNIEQAHQLAAQQTERLRFARALLDPAAWNKTQTRALAQAAAKDFLDLSILEQTHQVLAIPEKSPDGHLHDFEVIAQNRDIALGKLLKAKDANPFEILGRLAYADLLAQGTYIGHVAEILFDSAGAKPTDYPELHRLHLLAQAKTTNTQAA